MKKPPSGPGGFVNVAMLLDAPYAVEEMGPAFCEAIKVADAALVVWMMPFFFSPIGIPALIGTIAIFIRMLVRRKGQPQ